VCVYGLLAAGGGIVLSFGTSWTCDQELALPQQPQALSGRSIVSSRCDQVGK
jgi:hypothetical protein